MGRALALVLASALAYLSLESCTDFRDRSVGSGGADAGTTSTRTFSMRAGACTDARDCVSSSPCSTVECVDRKCVESPIDADQPLPANQQVVGDCRKRVCDEQGRSVSENDDTDKPEGDGNPCHQVMCEDGSLRKTNAKDGSTCNRTGSCNAGECSVCAEGSDCSRASDCTVFQIKCEGGKTLCEDTGMPRSERACEVGKVCQGGSCVPCVVGAACAVEMACHEGRVTSCDDGLVCEPKPLSGVACGTDAMNRTKYCVAGVCMMPCREGLCMSATDPCQTSHWDCSVAGAEPKCVAVPQPDGTSCADASACYAGACERNSLKNGDFSQGLAGWTITGAAKQFPIAPDPGNFGRLTLSSSPDGSNGGGSAVGTVSQTFAVPMDALAIRFVVFGGYAHVRLRDAAGGVVEAVTGMDPTSARIPVSWDLVKRRGQRITIAIEDDITTGDGAFIKATGFDVIRDVEVLPNAQFEQGWTGWQTSGDGLNFPVFDDCCYQVLMGCEPAFGQRRSASTYTRDSNAAGLGSAGKGVASQTFLVPNDATALRFNIHGGREPRVALYDRGDILYSASASESDFRKHPISWDLKPFRGKLLRLAIEDDTASGGFGYIGTSGFDLITSYNGP